LFVFFLQKKQEVDMKKSWYFLLVLVLLLNLSAPNVALARPQTSSIYGTVNDGGGHFYPLYARLDFYNLDTGISTYTFTNPDNGQYTMDMLPEGNDYSITVTTYLPGYETPSMTIYDLTSGGAEANFAIPPAPGCTAPGYHLETAYSTDFELNNGFLQVGGIFPSWAWGQPSGSVTPHSGSKVWATNLNGSYNVNENSFLFLQQDTSALSSGFTVQWWSRYQLSPMDLIRVKAWNGATWQIYEEIIGGNSGWMPHSISLDGSFARNDFILQFELTDIDADGTDLGWYIDDLQITTNQCVMDSGGLMYGYVTDLNTSHPISGVQIQSDGTPPFFAETKRWQNSPYDGLYVGFQGGPPFFVNLSTSHPFYAPQNQAVTFSDHSITRVDFSLISGVMQFNSGELSTVELPFLGNGMANLTLNNTGSLPVEFQLREALELGHSKSAPLSSSKDPQLFYGFNLDSRRLISFDAANASAMTTVATLPQMDLSGGDFLLGNPDWIYALRNQANGDTDLVMLSTTIPGQYLTLATLPPIPYAWKGLTGGMDGNFYAVAYDTATSVSQLYRITPAGNQVTPLGAELPNSRLVDVAMNRDGQLYALDSANDALLELDPQTGTVLGSTTLVGLDVKSEPQAIEFDDLTGTIYWMARSDLSPNTQFRRLSLDGTSTLLANLWPEAYTCLAAVNGGQPDISWLNLDVPQGTVLPGQSLTVPVQLDPSGFDMPPGVYHANLVLIDNAPDSPNQKRHGKIPVILTIVEPDLNFNAPPQAFEGDILPITLTFDADSDMTGHPIADAAEIVIDLPTGLSLVTGSLTADYGEVSYNPGNHQILWQTPDPLNAPPEAVNLTYTLTVEAGTHGQALTQTAQLTYGTYEKTATATIPILNRAPQLVQPLPDQQAIVQHSFAYSIPANSFSDADNDPLSYTAIGLPPGISLNSNGDFSGIPQQSGSFTITVRASDPFGDYAEDHFTLTVLSALYLPSIQR
jgi:hypothetical protein